jgi:hypothetical protein
MTYCLGVRFAVGADLWVPRSMVVGSVPRWPPVTVVDRSFWHGCGTDAAALRLPGCLGEHGPACLDSCSLGGRRANPYSSRDENSKKRFVVISDSTMRATSLSFVMNCSWVTKPQTMNTPHTSGSPESNRDLPRLGTMRPPIYSPHCQLGTCAVQAVVQSDLRVRGDRERPLVTGVIGTLIARRTTIRPALMAAS